MSEFHLFDVLGCISTTKISKKLVYKWHCKNESIDLGNIKTSKIITLTPKGPRGPKWVAAKTGHVITNCDLF
jgi:hypothetical protein